MHARSLVARNLRKLRVRRGLSQEALAVDAQVDRTYVSRVERGLENPTVAVLERLAIALDIEIVRFFEKPKAGEREPETLKGGRKRR
ncbi:helix-turn-helix transcriptional regulator [Parvibaculum sp.]|uniref:helix-turn-helix domain-containing protein n=1 Tax=Parvibaculum sp. TaxID=2024848 RepID=UPI001D9527D9|nr:helix-turn-helix transcriptional regulator [Parvibaculum sp.]MBX3488605.1 helix-turn-helix transcriptional regulator [Parvibaculum sp.]